MNKDILISIIIFFMVIIIVGAVLTVIADKSSETLYTYCCYENGGEILVSGFDCSIPSECAYCSVDIDLEKDCNMDWQDELK